MRRPHQIGHRAALFLVGAGLIVIALFIAISFPPGGFTQQSNVFGLAKGGGSKVVTECNDGIDNDGDGFIDYAGYTTGKGRNKITYPPDPDCESSTDTSESCIPTEEVCDGKDNNCNGLIDETCYCGDGLCTGNEVCSTCPGDCGECPAMKVSGALVPWGHKEGMESIRAHASKLTNVSPFWYRLSSTGSIIRYDNTASIEDPAVITELRALNLKIVPTIRDQDGRDTVVAAIGDASKRTAHAKAIAALVSTTGYDGIDIDYESLLKDDRSMFSAFIMELRATLPVDRTLSVNVYVKNSEPGTWDGTIAQDWSVIGTHADEVRVMVYDYPYEPMSMKIDDWSVAVAPVAWVEKYVKYAVETLPPGKAMHGIPLYGYDWKTDPTPDELIDSRMWAEYVARAKEFNATVRWDDQSKAPWFTYTDKSGARREVWFENAASAAAKLALSYQYNVGGVFFWRLGNEDPGTWEHIR